MAVTTISTTVAQTKIQIPTIEAFNFDEVTYTPEKTTFKLFAPKDMKYVIVTIYDQDIGPNVVINPDDGSDRVISSGDLEKSYKMKYGKDHVWKVVVKGDLKGKYYTFNVADHKRWGMGCIPVPLKYGTFYGETPGVFHSSLVAENSKSILRSMSLRSHRILAHRSSPAAGKLVRAPPRFLYRSFIWT